jgi:hypothetical protein
MSVTTQAAGLKSLQDSMNSLLRDIRYLRTGGMPRSADLRAAPTIDQWSYGLVPARCIVGSVCGHPILGDRARIHTSEIILIDPESGWARTWSRYYRLGAPEVPATPFESS